MGGNFNPPLFSIKNSEMVKPVTLAFFRLQLQSIRHISAKFSIPNLSQSPDIGQNSDMCVSNFRISGQFLIKENCHNSRISNNFDMKLEPVTKLDKRNTAMLKKLTMMPCWQIVTSLCFFQFMDNLKQTKSCVPKAWSVKLSFLLIVTFNLTKIENRTKKFLTQF